MFDAIASRIKITKIQINMFMFTEMFVNVHKQTDNIKTLIKVLNEPSMQLKRATLHLLKVMLGNCPDQLQAGFLNTPEAIGAVMELLNVGMNEVVRNEALLLMIELTQDRKDGKLSKQIQKMVGFHSAFEKIFDIIQEEGLSDGFVFNPLFSSFLWRGFAWVCVGLLSR